MLHLQSVCEEVGVRHAPTEGPELHDRNEACQVEHFSLHVLAILHPTEVKQLGACTGMPLHVMGIQVLLQCMRSLCLLSVLDDIEFLGECSCQHLIGAGLPTNNARYVSNQEILAMPLRQVLLLLGRRLK